MAASGRPRAPRPPGSPPAATGPPAPPAGPLSDDVAFVAVPSLVDAVPGQGGDADRRGSAEEQVADGLADRWALEEAVAGEAGRVQEPGRSAGLADQGVVVGGHLVQA